MKKILVTGGGGFIGSNIVAALAARGTYKITVCDRFGHGDKWRNLVKHPVWEIIPPDALDDWLEQNGSELEMIYHIGAISSTVEKDIDLILQHNLTKSLMLWRWAIKHGVRFVYASSSATYGDGSNGFDDSMELDYLRKLTPMTGYGWSKHLFDTHVAMSSAHKEALPPQWVGLKFFNAYGPNEYHKDNQMSVISQIAPQALLAGQVKLFRSYNPKYPDGGQQRDVIYVKDCVKVMLWLLDNPSINGLYNLGTGQARSFADMARAIFAALGKETRLHYIDMPETITPKYQYFTQANMQKLRSAGYTDNFTTLEDGVKDYVRNYMAQPDPYL